MNPLLLRLLQAAGNTGKTALRNLDVQTRRNMGPAARRGLGIDATSTGLIRSLNKPDPGFLRAAASSVLATPSTKTVLGVTGTAAGVDLANQTGLTDAIQNSLNQVAPAADRFFGGITPQVVQEFGRQQEKKGLGGALELSTPFGFAVSGLIPNTKARTAPTSTPERVKGTQAILNGNPVYWTGSRYGWQSGPSAAKAGLLGSEVVGDDAFATANSAVVPVSSAPALSPPAASVLPPPAQGPADRAYQRAKAETAAMVATNPMMQQWEKARQAKDYTTADQLGQQIWQSIYRQTPLAQPGGFIGSFNPLMEHTFKYQTGMSPRDIAQTITNPSPAPVAPGEAPYQIGDLGTRAMAETGYDPAAYGVTTEMVEEMKKKLLQQSTK